MNVGNGIAIQIAKGTRMRHVESTTGMKSIGRRLGAKGQLRLKVKAVILLTDSMLLAVMCAMTVKRCGHVPKNRHCPLSGAKPSLT
jgi:hypothetical protein